VRVPSSRTATDTPHPDATITTDAATLLSVLADHSRLAATLKSEMTIAGDRRVVRRLIEGVVVPRPAPIDTRE
jgi:hypothetical protein